MTTVNDIADILRIVREQPEWAEALRAALMGQELLELPQRFAEFAVAVEKRFAGLDADVAELKAGQARLEAAVSRLDAAVSRLETEFSRLDATVSDLAANFSRLDATVEKRFAALEADVAELKAGQARLDAAVSRLEIEVSRLDATASNLIARVSRIEGHLGNMRGNDYQLKIGNNIASIAIQHLGLRRVRVLKGYKVFDDMPFHDLLFDAEDRGDISQQERLDAGNADIVLEGRTHPEQSTVYIVVEVSLTAADYDVTRAAAWADTMRRATGEPSIPAVVSAQWDESRQRLAEERGVAAITIAETKRDP